MAILESFIQYLRDSHVQYNSGDNTVSFEIEGLNYVFLYSPDDSNYFRLMLPRIISFEDNGDGDNKRLLEVALEISTKYKVGKVILFDGSLWLTFEAFVPSVDIDISSLFKRAIRILRLMIDDFRELVRQ